MPDFLEIRKIDKAIVDDSKFGFTFTSYFLILVIYINLIFSKSPILGGVIFIAYFLVNGVFLAHAFFPNEKSLFLRWSFGLLSLIMLLGFVGWLVMLIYNLDLPLFVLTLIIVTTVSSLVNHRRKMKNARR